MAIVLESFSIGAANGAKSSVPSCRQ